MILALTIAFLFHKTALIMIVPLIIYCFIGIREVIISPKLILSMILLWILKWIISLNLLILKILEILKLDQIHYKVESYMNSKFAAPFSLLDPRLLLAFLIFVTLQYIVKNKSYGHFTSSKDKNMIYLLYVCSFMNILLYIILSDATIFAVRFTHYFNIFSALSIPMIVYLIRDRLLSEKKWSKFKFNMDVLFRIGIVLFFVVYILYTLSVLPKVPYKFYLFGF